MNDTKRDQKQIRALVVDDDSILLKLLIKFLKDLNFQGSMASNGQEAVDLARKGDYDICFMDIQMPLMDGLEATKIIRDEISKTLPIVAVTSIEDFTYEMAIEAGMNDYLGKPIAIEHLKRVINKHCNTSH